MATFDGNGLIIDRLADIKLEMQTELQTTFGAGINLAETSPMGILIGMMAERYYLLWEKLEAVYIASFPETAYGVYLDEVCAFNGVVRQPATKSAVDLTFTRNNNIGDGDVIISAGTQCNAVGSSVLWSTLAEATILDAENTVVTSASPEDYGVIGATAGSITVMVSAPANVGTVTNVLAAENGTAEETDAELKARRNIELGRLGTATESGIRSALQALDIISAAYLVLNDTGAYVGTQPPHSIICYVDLVSPASTGDEATRDAVAQAIWDAKGAGINTFGEFSGTAVDANGDDQTVSFSQVTTTNIDTIVLITITDDYDAAVSDDAIKQAIQDYSATGLTAGEDVLNYKVTGAAANVGAAGILELTTTIAYSSGGGFTDTYLTIGPEELAFLSVDDITITKTGP